MKKIISATFALTAIAAVTPASAGTIELDYASGRVQCVQLYSCRPLVGKIGTFAYATASSDWAEAYGGLTYAPTPEVELAYGIGREQGTSQTRTGGSVWIGKGKASCLYLFEDGGSGPWKKVVLKYQATPKLTLGYVEKYFAGKGLYVEYALSKGVCVKFSGYSKPEAGLVLPF